MQSRTWARTRGAVQWKIGRRWMSSVFNEQREAGLADVECEVLGHLVPVDDGADLEGNLGLAARRLPGARETAAAISARARSVAARRSRRLRVRAGEIGIAAHDEPFARKVGGRNGRDVTLVEQRHLQGPAFGERPDGRRTQRRDPVEPGRGDLGVETCLRDHPAVADQHHVLEREAGLDLVDLSGERARVGGIALEHFDGHRTTVCGAQQAVDDLQLALLAVAIGAELGEFAAASLQIVRRHVVEPAQYVNVAPVEQVYPAVRTNKPLDRVLTDVEASPGVILYTLLDQSRCSIAAFDGGFESLMLQFDNLSF
jgi:hypothetical protein